MHCTFDASGPSLLPLGAMTVSRMTGMFGAVSARRTATAKPDYSAFLRAFGALASTVPRRNADSTACSIGGW